MVKETYKRIPVDQENFVAVEEWLERMAAQGYFAFDAWGGRYFFRVGEPRQVRYRLDPPEDDEPYPDTQKKEDYEAMGWHYLMTRKNKYHIFMTEDPEAEEFHTDSQVQSCIFEKQEKKLFRITALVLVLAGAELLAQRDMLTGLFRYPVLYEAETGMLFPFIICLPSLILAELREVITYYNVRRLRKRLAAGGKLERGRLDDKSILRGKWFNRVFWMLILLAAVTFFLDSCSGGTTKELELGTGPLPVLECLEGPEIELAAEGQSDNQSDDVAYSRNSPILKANYEFRDAGEIKERKWKDGGGPYRPYVEVWYYEIRNFLPLEEILTADMVRKYLNRPDDFEAGGLIASNAPGFDTYLLKRSGNKQVLIARRGKQVLRMEYEGEERLEEHWEAAAKILNTVFRQRGGSSDE